MAIPVLLGRSGRRLGDPNTNFGLELIKNYSSLNRSAASFVSYPLTLKDGREVKSTTIPLFDKKYGLIGFICVNFDVSKLNSKDVSNLKVFVDAITQTRSDPKIKELIHQSLPEGKK